MEKSGNENAAFPAAVQRVRLCVRLAAGLAVLLSFLCGGQFWAWGAFLGAALVEINLGLLWRLLKNAGQWRGPGLRPTLMRFYLAFGATALVCFLVIRNHWGHPVGFLLGLFSFILGLALALISLAARPKAD